MLSFHKYITEVTNVEATIVNLLRLAQRPGTPEEGAVALRQAKRLADKHHINIDDLKDKVEAQPQSKQSNQDPYNGEGVDAVWAMWEASIRDADDHQHGFQFTGQTVRFQGEPARVYKSAKFPKFTLYIRLYNFVLMFDDKEAMSGVGSFARRGAFRMVLISTKHIYGIWEWVDQVRGIAEKAGYVVFKEPHGGNGNQTWLKHKKNGSFIVRIYGYDPDSSYDNGIVVAFDEKSRTPYFVKAKHEDPKSLKTFAAALKTNKPDR